jgi:hypothetical protein
MSRGTQRERRLGIFPVGSDSTGTEGAANIPGDYPQLLPGVVAESLDHNGVGWMLLSAGKKALASSSRAGHPVALAFDEDARSWWSAASGGVGEWLGVDLGMIERVTALQINFAEEETHALGRDEDSYEQYIIESSLDGVHWTTRLDESGATRDVPHHYIQLDSARNARFVRITNVHAAAGGAFAIRDLRIFGRSPLAPPPAVAGLTVRRDADGQATLTWTATARATGYVVRYGAAPNRLDATYRVGVVTSLTVDGLTPGTAYWFAVDAIGEGGITPARTPIGG